MIVLSASAWTTITYVQALTMFKEWFPGHVNSASMKYPALLMAFFCKWHKKYKWQYIFEQA